MKIYKYLREKRFKSPSFSLDVSYDMRLAGERGREKPVLPLVWLKTPCPLDVLLAAPVHQGQGPAPKLVRGL